MTSQKTNFKEFENILIRKVTKKVKYFGIVFCSFYFLMYLNRTHPKLARKLYFDRIFNNQEATSGKDESNSFYNFVIFY